MLKTNYVKRTQKGYSFSMINQFFRFRSIFPVYEGYFIIDLYPPLADQKSHLGVSPQDIDNLFIKSLKGFNNKIKYEKIAIITIRIFNIQIKALFLSALQAIFNNELPNGTMSQFGILKAFSLINNKSICLKECFLHCNSLRLQKLIFIL